MGNASSYELYTEDSVILICRYVRHKQIIIDHESPVHSHLAFPSSCQLLLSQALLLSFCLADVFLLALLTTKTMSFLNSAVFNEDKCPNVSEILSHNLVQANGRRYARAQMAGDLKSLSQSQGTDYFKAIGHWFFIKFALNPCDLILLSLSKIISCSAKRHRSISHFSLYKLRHFN